MKEKYIALMDKALDAYSYGQITDYFKRVKRDGLTEHGFPRLTANIGIMIASGRRHELKEMFLEMMEFCCENMHKVKAANDFSVRELVLCIMELERSGLFDKAVTDGFRAHLAMIEPTECYNQFAKSTDELKFNWALFTAVSEFVRKWAGIGGDTEFIETQIGSQMKLLDENGMYRDALTNPPMVYDAVSRGLFSMLLHFGYRGKYYDELSHKLRHAALCMLKMQSVTGEMPFGGRSNQFIHNEAWLALIFEFEAARCKKEGDPKLAARFKEAAVRALDTVERWLTKTPIRHIKNRFPTQTKYGCEGYAYFDKYMITVASFLYMASLMCDDDILPCSRNTSARDFETSEHFHKYFMHFGDYSLEFELDGDPHYDASGLGRIQRFGAPSAICISGSCPSRPKIDLGDNLHTAFSVCPATDTCDGIVTSADVKHTVTESSMSADGAYCALSCDIGEKTIRSAYSITQNGVEITVSGEDRVGLMLPAFEFDGEAYTEIRSDAHSLTVKYEGYICRYETDGVIDDMSMMAYNRNGYYRCFAAMEKGKVNVKISIEKI